jgi:Leucine Rich repeat
MPALQELHLGHNRLTGADAVVALLATGEQLGALTRLCLGCNLLGDSGAKALSALMHALPNVRMLGLQSNGIGDSGAQALSATLASVRLLCGCSCMRRVPGSASAETPGECALAPTRCTTAPADSCNKRWLHIWPPLGRFACRPRRMRSVMPPPVLADLSRHACVLPVRICMAMCAYKACQALASEPVRCSGPGGAA